MMGMRKFLGAGVLFLCVLARPAGATLVNGDFAGGLAGWTSLGNVSAGGQVAAMSDNDAPYSLLFQGDQVQHGMFRIDFDFKGDLSPEVPSGAFADTFFASLYFADDAGKFDLPNQKYDAGTGLFDLDRTGASNVNGTIGASSAGEDWSHFTLTFLNGYNYIIPTFELFDLNFAGNDSQVLLDNIRLEHIPDTVLIPEPAPLILMGLGLLALLFNRRKLSRHRAGPSV